MPDDPDLDAAEREVDDIERAISKLDEGAYGTCEACGETIAESLLTVDPARRTCAAHEG